MQKENRKILHSKKMFHSCIQCYINIILLFSTISKSYTAQLLFHPAVSLPPDLEVSLQYLRNVLFNLHFLLIPPILG